jgi:hypothetical protein
MHLNARIYRRTIRPPFKLLGPNRCLKDSSSHKAVNIVMPTDFLLTTVLYCIKTHDDALQHIRFVRVYSRLDIFNELMHQYASRFSIPPTGRDCGT